jgi:hypothetical protein
VLKNERERPASELSWLSLCARHAPSLQPARGRRVCSGAYGVNSGSLLNSFNGAGMLDPLARSVATRPRVFIGILPTTRPLEHGQPDVRHYAAVSLISSMELGRESEIQSKGFGQPSYSRSNARSLEAGDYRIDPAREAEDCSHRRQRLLVQERDRELPARRAGAEAQDPPQKIKLGHYRNFPSKNGEPICL